MTRMQWPGFESDLGLFAACLPPSLSSLSYLSPLLLSNGKKMALQAEELLPAEHWSRI